MTKKHKFFRVFARKKRNRAIRLDHQIVKWERVKVSVSCAFARHKRVERKESAPQGGKAGSMEKQGKQREPSLGKVEESKGVSGPKRSPGRSEESWFHFKSAQT